jgi:hypothetical protein
MTNIQIAYACGLSGVIFGVCVTLLAVEVKRRKWVRGFIRDVREFKPVDAQDQWPLR